MTKRELDNWDLSHKPLKLVHFSVAKVLNVFVYSTQRHIDFIIPYITFAAYTNFICLFLSVLLDLIWGPRKHYSEAAFLEKKLVVPIWFKFIVFPSTVRVKKLSSCLKLSEFSLFSEKLTLLRPRL